jgi:hypothetical protein
MRESEALGIRNGNRVARPCRKAGRVAKRQEASPFAFLAQLLMLGWSGCEGRTVHVVAIDGVCTSQSPDWEIRFQWTICSRMARRLVAKATRPPFRDGRATRIALWLVGRVAEHVQERHTATGRLARHIFTGGR